MSKSNDELYELKDWLAGCFKGFQDADSTSRTPASCEIAANFVIRRFEAILATEIQAAKEDLATKIMLTCSEGLFDGPDLFVKRAPIEQTIINEIGYEKFKAIQEAANDKERARSQSPQIKQKETE